MPFALNLTPDPEASLGVERVLALGIGEEQLVTQYGPCVTSLVVEDSVHPDDLLEMLRRHVLRTASISLTLVEPCIIPGNPPKLSLRASPVQALLTLHDAMFRSVPEQAVHLHYRPAYWQPHLKLANVSADPAVSRVFVERLAAKRVLWSNAGHIVEAFLGMLERDAGASTGSAAVRDCSRNRWWAAR